MTLYHFPSPHSDLTSPHRDQESPAAAVWPGLLPQHMMHQLARPPEHVWREKTLSDTQGGLLADSTSEPEPLDGLLMLQQTLQVRAAGEIRQSALV